MIEVRDLTKTYDEIKALKGVSFTVERGEIVGFLGPNGAGKSTTMKIITGFVPATRGTVTVDRKSIDTHSLEVRKKIGYLPESNPLYTEMTVYDYLAFVARIRGVKAGAVKTQIGKAVRMCGLLDRVGQVIGTLSKGYRQRVGLAQALIHDPEILILDEPTSGLDPNQIVEIRNLIKSLGKDRTIILSTHNLPEVMATCSRMIIVHDGRLVADGTADELQASEEENPRIRLVVTGVTFEAARDVLSGLDGVDSVSEGVTALDGAVALEVLSKKGRDVRSAIFSAAVEHGWQLIELHRLVLDLEGIFRKLTEVR